MPNLGVCTAEILKAVQHQRVQNASTMFDCVYFSFAH